MSEGLLPLGDDPYRRAALRVMQTHLYTNGFVFARSTSMARRFRHIPANFKRTSRHHAGV
jgi:hypothetical protein